MVVAAVLNDEACSTAAWSPNASAARPGKPPSAGSTAPRWRTPVSSRGIARQPCMAANCGYNMYYTLKFLTTYLVAGLACVYMRHRRQPPAPRNASWRRIWVTQLRHAQARTDPVQTRAQLVYWTCATRLKMYAQSQACKRACFAHPGASTASEESSVRRRYGKAGTQTKALPRPCSRRNAQPVHPARTLRSSTSKICTSTGQRPQGQMCAQETSYGDNLS